MPSSSDRSEEWSILRTVYSDRQCQSVIHSDLPDFVLIDGSTEQPFGVEVTEMFRSESEARAIHHPDYLARLFDGGRHMHRDDKTTLNVKIFAIRHEDGTQQSIPAVMMPDEPIQIRYERLAEIIHTKATRPYQPGLRHINLIIRDRFDLMGDRREQYCVSTLMGCGVREALLASPFREVYWITVVEGSDEQVYRPLRLLMMLERFWLFFRGLHTWLHDFDDLTPENTVLLFADYCTRSGIDVRLWVVHGKLYVLHMGIAVGLGEDGGTEVLDNRDNAISDYEIHPRAPGGPALTDVQFIAASEYLDSNGLTTEYYCEAATPANLRYPIMKAARLKRIEENDK